MAWLVNWEDRKYNTDDLTGREILALQDYLGVPWLRFRPKGDARHALAIVATFLSRDRSEKDVEKVLDTILDHVTVRDLGDIIEHIDDDLPDTFTDGVPDPKAEDPGTSTSSCSPASTAGLPTS